MTEPFYVSRCRIDIVQNTHRRVQLEAGGAFDTGVHGPIKRHYKLDEEKDLPLPVDFLVGATGAWMLGTLNGALAARAIRLDPADITATAEGTNEMIDGIIKLTRIHVHYRLRIPAGTRDTVDRALARHRDKCPTAQSLAGSIAVDWTADVIGA